MATKTNQVRARLWEKIRMPSGVQVLSKINQPFQPMPKFKNARESLDDHRRWESFLASKD